MKRIALILLIAVYSIASFGFGIRQFYCCGRLKSSDISFVEGKKMKCGMDEKNDGCCKTKYQWFKVKDSHFAASDLNLPLKYSSDLFLFSSFLTIHELIGRPDNETNPSHAPPIYQRSPLYILNCLYRI